MKIAQAKRKENIAEYLLYMWQVEDIIRAFNLDINAIKENIIDHYDVDDQEKKKITDWWEGLVMMMQHEGKQEHGHLQINKNTLLRLADLHDQLLKSTKYPEYGAEFYRTLPFIVELRSKTPEGQQVGELETCFNALYGTLLLKLQGKEVSQDTQVAIAQISHFIGILAAYFKKDEQSPLLGEEETK
ncbi:MAG: DUF4924 family protein [Muribaculaceae bacterium]|nr:DUF4924 family protein [Muribaculaceae bacterium]MBQ2562445.1 DUF4924 family protein [Muribaculaceae bacterium]